MLPCDRTTDVCIAYPISEFFIPISDRSRVPLKAASSALIYDSSLELQNGVRVHYALSDVWHLCSSRMAQLFKQQTTGIGTTLPKPEKQTNENSLGLYTWSHKSRPVYILPNLLFHKHD